MKLTGKSGWKLLQINPPTPTPLPAMPRALDTKNQPQEIKRIECVEK